MSDRLREGDVVLQSTYSDIQIEGVFDNRAWVIVESEFNGKKYLEAVSFDGKTHCSVGLLEESEYEVIGNIYPLIRAEVDKARRELGYKIEKRIMGMEWHRAAPNYINGNVALAIVKEEAAHLNTQESEEQ